MHNSHFPQDGDEPAPAWMLGILRLIHFLSCEFTFLPLSTWSYKGKDVCVGQGLPLSRACAKSSGLEHPRGVGAAPALDVSKAGLECESGNIITG